MTTNLQSLLQMVEEDIVRPDKRSRWPEWVNRGLRLIQQGYNFPCMRLTADFTIPLGDTSVLLPVEFKELDRRRTPAFIISGGTAYPVDVSDEVEVLTAIAPSPFVTARAPSPYMPIPFLKTDGLDARTRLAVADPTTEAVTYRLNFYRYLPDLEAPTDSNWIANNYPELVRAHIKAVAYADLSDPAAIPWEATAKRLLEQVEGDLERQKLAGRTIRMGG